MSLMSRRRKARVPDDMPGLFDNLDVDEAFVVSNAAETPKRKVDPAIADLSMAADDVERPDRLRFMSFGSGSSGNCSYVGVDRCGILVDAGIDNNIVVKALEKNGIDLDTVRGILITHDHVDHVRFAYSLLRRYRHMKLFCTPRVLNGMLRRHSISRRIKDYHSAIYKEFTLHVGPLAITPFETSHDGSDNMGFSISINDDADHTLVIATDMGKITDRADYYIRRARFLMIESNYDDFMLRHGPYKDYLKARIASERGHMDNAATAAYLNEIWNPQMHSIFLCHLSDVNNTPEAALEASRKALEARGISVGDFSGTIDMRDRPVQLMALPRYEPTDLFVL